MSDGGKGSKQRPGKGYEDNYDRIFGKKPSEKLKRVFEEKKEKK